MYQFTKKKVKGDRLILTNTALCLGHQHLIKKKKNYTDLHQPVLLHSQDGRVVGATILEGQANFRVCIRKRLVISCSANYTQLTV